ncbi:tetratricopeptide repeat protein 4 [Plakobranchus ocellatus]|uniref:Tetratricopeptide repeat protein 4 n=1 Tax=Plakobranchus ocellatus TaxID=259542 RepID=A0AAV4D3P9_9GAST|nr:tetratricopeptide repeat protein 4 [Plakobranchus ocellatus]
MQACFAVMTRNTGMFRAVHKQRVMKDASCRTGWLVALGGKTSDCAPKKSGKEVFGDNFKLLKKTVSTTDKGKMSSSKRSMTDEEREALVQKLAADLEDFVAERSIAARKRKEAEPEDNKSIDEIVEELKNHPAFLQEIDYSKPLPPEIEGLMQLKYESENPTARADSYRDDGNEQFKLKKYAIAIDNYTEGIKSKSPDLELNAVLYANRAAAQYHRANYRSSFMDCICARKFKPDHMKAIVRGAQCCFQMNKFADCLRWCDAVLMLDPEHKVILDLRVRADKRKREQERDERKQALQERKEEAEERKLLQAITSRGIQVSSVKVSKDSKLDPLLLTALESHNPTGAKVHLDEEQRLYWPVLFFYPEFAETDFIHAFCETNCIYDHLAHMFGPEVEPATWDTEKKYKADTIEVFFENKDEEKLYKVNPDHSLLDVLKHKKYVVSAGTPTFILMVRDSRFQKEFLSRYKT